MKTWQHLQCHMKGKVISLCNNVYLHFQCHVAGSVFSCLMKTSLHLQCHVKGKVISLCNNVYLHFQCHVAGSVFSCLMKTWQHLQCHVKDKVISLCSEGMSLFSVPCRSQDHLIFLEKTLIMRGECARIDKFHLLETRFIDKPAVLEDEFFSLVKFFTFHYKITWVLRRKWRASARMLPWFYFIEWRLSCHSIFPLDWSGQGRHSTQNSPDSIPDGRVSRV
jgi:hypothetical protein